MLTDVARRVPCEPQGREDPEVRALMQAACSALTDRRPPTPLRLPPHRTTEWHRWLAVLFALPVLALPLRMALAAPRVVDAPRAVDGSRIWDAAGFVESDAPASAGKFLVATVHDKAADQKRARLAMKRSQRDAYAAALRCTARHARGGLRLRSQGVGGPSAGLMFGLAIVDHLDAVDLTRGRKIAGTGTLSAGGAVGPVGAVVKKARAAQRAGAQLFFVPDGQRAEAVRAAASLKVVGVKHLSDAVRVLLGSGCRR